MPLHTEAAPTTEQSLWSVLGPTEEALLANVRSRRNRRELYRRLLDEALFVQQFYQPVSIEVDTLEQQVRAAIRAELAETMPEVDLGIPIRQSVVMEGALSADYLFIDLRGQAPARALGALKRAAEEHARSRSVLGLVIYYGEAGQADLLKSTVTRWIADFGRGQVFKAGIAKDGLLLALDLRRIGQLQVQPPPLAAEIQTLRQLLQLVGERRALGRVTIPNHAAMQAAVEGAKKKRTRRGGRNHRKHKPAGDRTG